MTRLLSDGGRGRGGDCYLVYIRISSVEGDPLGSFHLGVRAWLFEVGSRPVSVL